VAVFALWPESAWAIIRAAGRFFADEFRRTPVYRALLKPIFPEELPAPSFGRPAHLGNGQDILSGVWRFRGEVLQLDADANPWARACPSRGFARDLHSFGWLRDVIATGEEGVARAQTVTAQWVDEFGDWNTYAWTPPIVSERLINWLAVAPVVFSGPHADACFISFARQARHLRLTANRATGAARIKALSANALVAATLAGDGRWLHRALDQLSQCLQQSLMADGTPRDRNPTTAAETFFDLLALHSVLGRLNLDTPEPITHAIGRLGEILRFFSCDDGGLSLFQGGYEYTAAALQAAFARAGTTPGTFSFAHEGGYQRAATAGGLLMFDGGAPASGAWSVSAHAAPLAFEYGYKGWRIIVNCGHGREGEWRDRSRLTAAHSTLVANDVSCAGVLPDGLRRRLMGARLYGLPKRVVCRREDEGLHTWLDATHDGYLRPFGFVHARRLYLAEEGDDLRGEDTVLWSRPRGSADIAIRFHLHPSVRATPTRDGQGVLLTDGAGEGWTFKSSARDVTIEPSVYLGADGRPEKTEQIVLRTKARASADVQDPDNVVRWALTRVNRPWG
jgi:uncharacterized heparinase superfamily protein